MLVVAVLARTRAQGVEPTDVTVFQQETVLLTCSGSKVAWLRLEQQSGSSLPVTTKIFTSPATWHVHQGTKYDTNGTYNLIIKDAQAATDGGMYQCDTDENPNQLLNANLVVVGNVSLNLFGHYNYKLNKNSAVAEMGDRGHNRHGLKEGMLCPFRGALGTRLIQCGRRRGLLPHQVASTSIQPFGHNSVGCHSPRRNISTNYYLVVEMYTGYSNSTLR